MDTAGLLLSSTCYQNYCVSRYIKLSSSPCCIELNELPFFVPLAFCCVEYGLQFLWTWSSKLQSGFSDLPLGEREEIPAVH